MCMAGAKRPMSTMTRSVSASATPSEPLGPESRNLAYLAHELRTPLAGINGLMALLADGSLGPLSTRQQTVVDLVRRNVAHLECLSAEFLDFAAIETGTLRLRPHPFDVGATVQEVVALLTPEAEAKGAYLESRVRPKHAEVNLDATRFREVLFNLIGNALRHSPVGGRVDIIVNVERSALALSVGDQGEGIDDAIRGNLFRAFEGKDAGGHGLGLSVVEGIVRAQGGLISVLEGDPGTVFRVHLPLPCDDVPASADSSTQRP